MLIGSGAFIAGGALQNPDGIRFGGGTHGAVLQYNGQTGACIQTLVSGINVGNGLAIGFGAAAIEGNLIGTNATGTSALANARGVALNSASGITIGGSTTGAGNVISGNVGDGVSIDATSNGSSVDPSDGTSTSPPVLADLSFAPSSQQASFTSPSGLYSISDLLLVTLNAGDVTFVLNATLTPASVPEPTTMLMCGVGLACMAFAPRRRGNTPRVTGLAASY